MRQIWAIGAVLALAGIQQGDRFTLRVAGIAGGVKGIVVNGVEYVPLKDTADLLRAKLTTEQTGQGDKEVTLTPGAPRSGFNDEPDTVIAVDGNTSTWQTVANSNGTLRVREFTRSKDSWTIVGELEVARQSLMAEGRVPQGLMTLNLYVVCRDADGKVLDRDVAQVKGVSYDGGRYKLTLDTQNGTGHLPATVDLRFNYAVDSGADR